MDICPFLKQGATSFEKDFVVSCVDHLAKQFGRLPDESGTIVFLGSGTGRAEICFALHLWSEYNWRFKQVILIDIEDYSEAVNTFLETFPLPFDVVFEQERDFRNVLMSSVQIEAVLALNMETRVSGKTEDEIIDKLRNQLDTYDLVVSRSIFNMAFNYSSKVDGVFVKPDFMRFLCRRLSRNDTINLLINAFWTNPKITGTVILRRHLGEVRVQLWFSGRYLTFEVKTFGDLRKKLQTFRGYDENQTFYKPRIAQELEDITHIADVVEPSLYYDYNVSFGVEPPTTKTEEAPVVTVKSPPIKKVMTSGRRQRTREPAI
jgi:hypothetical protein